MRVSELRAALEGVVDDAIVTVWLGDGETHDYGLDISEVQVERPSVAERLTCPPEVMLIAG